MVRISVRIQKKELRRQWIQEKKRLSGPKQMEDQVKYHEVLEQELNEIADELSIQTQYDKLCELIEQAAVAANTNQGVMKKQDR